MLSDALEIHDDAWIAATAVIEGDVRIGAESSVWHQCVLRGDLAHIRIGARTNVQDACVLHVDSDWPVRIGNEVTVGHRAVVHGCRIGDGAVVGMGAVLLTGCEIGAGALVAAGAVVREGQRVAEAAIVAGVPAKPIGEVDASARARFAEGVRLYVEAARTRREEESRP